MKTEAPVIICFDLDGTLVQDDGSIHPRDIEILQQRRDLVLIPSTGRAREPLVRLFREHHVFNGQDFPLPFVAQNGAITYLPGERRASMFAFPEAVQAEILATLEAHTDLTIIMTGEHDTLEMAITPYGRYAEEKYRYQVSPYRPEHRAIPFCKAMCLSDEPDVLAQVCRELAHLPVEAAYSMSTIVEFTPRGVNKATGVRSLLAHMGLDGLPVYAAGDGLNDAAMLQDADLAFVPITAPDHMREHADVLIDIRPEGLLTPILRRLNCLD